MQGLPNSIKTELLTVNDWIRFGATVLQKQGVYFGHGTDNAWDESAQLVLWVIATPWEKLEQVQNTRLVDAEKNELLGLFDKRINERIPSPYLTGESYFCGLKFLVNEHVLIPRSPIGELIENQFQPWLSHEPDQVLDLCTGSGCIGIACAYTFPDALVMVSDISPDALKVAQSNVDQHELKDRISVIESDLFENVQGSFGLIVSNSPYVDQEDMSSLPKEYLHEPSLALASGDDGLDFTRRLLAQAPAFLVDDGVLVAEVGNSWEALEQAFPAVPFMWLEFEKGGHGVFLLTKSQLQEHAADFA